MALTGVDLLEAMLTFLEDRVLQNGLCACGQMMDVTVDVTNPLSTSHPAYAPNCDVFEFTCVNCRRKYTIPMNDLASGPPVPDVPEADWPVCSICHTKHKPIYAALKGTCPECEKVSRDVGQIVGVREEESIL